MTAGDIVSAKQELMTWLRSLAHMKVTKPPTTEQAFMRGYAAGLGRVAHLHQEITRMKADIGRTYDAENGG